MQLSYITAEMHDNFAKALEAGARVGVGDGDGVGAAVGVGVDDSAPTLTLD